MEEFGDKQLCLFRDGGELVPSGSLVDGAERRWYLQQLRECYQSRRDGHPAPNPVSIERRQIGQLRAQPYLAALKSDGVRYSLLLTKYDGEPRALMINRSLDVYEVEVWANEAFFEAPTLFDGELVWESVEAGLRLLYLVFDVIRLRGRRCDGLRYSDRLAEVHRHILSELPAGVHETDVNLEQMIIDEDKVFAMNNPYGLRLLPKRFVPMAQLDALWETRGASRHRNDGLVFVKDSAKISTGTDYDMFKWKPENTIDIKYIHERSGAQHLLFLSRGSEVAGDEVLFHGETWNVRLEANKMIQCLIEAERKRDGTLCAILECLCKLHADERRVQLFPIKCRVDKSTPNDVAVVRATLKNVEEAIGYKDLQTSSDSDSTRPREVVGSFPSADPHSPGRAEEESPPGSSTAAADAPAPRSAERPPLRDDRVRTRSRTRGGAGTGGEADEGGAARRKRTR